MGLGKQSDSFKIVGVLVLVGAIGYVTAQGCKQTGFGFDDEKCAKGWEEVWKDSAAGQTNRQCCDKKDPKFEKNVRAREASCRVTKCEVSSSGSVCSTLYDRYKKGKKLSYEEILREPCKTESGGQGTVGLCCEKGSTEGQLATTMGAEPNEFPHMAKLRLPGHCGGTVYNKRFIVTAAHCIVGKEDYKLKSPVGMEVVLGSNLGDIKAKEYVYKVKRLIPHEEYSKMEGHSELDKSEGQRTFNDIALMELDRDIVFGPNVKALEIAPKGFNPAEYSDKAVIVGWGTTDTLQISMHLQRANFVIRNDPTCFAKPRKGVKGYGAWHQMDGMEDQLLCVGGVRDGIWSPTAGGGDSGGPAICRGKNGKIVLCGVTSFGADDEECAKYQNETSCYPSVYAEVSHFHDWITTHAGRQDPSTFYQPYLYGEPVTKGKYPHQVHITSSEGKPCGGTLIAPDFVVTAAQCVVKSGGGSSYRDIKVTTGIIGLDGKGKTYGAKGVATIPGFERVGEPVNIEAQGNRVRITDNFYKNDLAILRLDGNVDISPSKIPAFPESNPEYGAEVALPRPTETNPNKEMRSREFRFLGQNECQTRMDRLSSAGLNIKVDKNLLCGVEKYSGGSVCDRELGGGIICKGANGKETLCGVQVFRICMSSIPNGFMNMVLFKDYVKAAMKKL